MEELKNIGFLAALGMKDCICGIFALRYLWTKKSKSTTRQRRDPSENQKPLSGVLIECMVFGGLYWAGISIFYRGILNFCISYLESLLLEPEEIEKLSWLPILLGVLFGVAWTLPLFICSKILNFSWYQQIADLTFENTGGKKKPSNFSYDFSDMVESTTVQLLFMIQGYAMLLLPLPGFIRHTLYYLHLSILYALYSFEYKWVQMGWGLQRRLAYVSSKWPYFLGFGSLLAIASSCFGNFVESICIFSTFFPIYVISSTVTIDRRVQFFKMPIKFFSLASRITNFCLLFGVTYFTKKS